MGRMLNFPIFCQAWLFLRHIALPWLALALGLLPVHLLAQAAGAPAQLEVYVRDGCPYCEAAKEFLPDLLARHPEVEVVLRAVDTDAVARDDLLRYMDEAGIVTPGVPAFRYQGRLQVGFASPELSGPALERLLDAATPAGGTRVETTLFGTLSVERMGLPLFTLALGMLDGFNPCAMWVLLFLLSLLVHMHDRRRMALIAGTFVLASGLVYYVFMAAWLNLFLAVGLTTGLRVMLALVALVIAAINIKDFVRPGTGFSLSIPETAKSGLYARMRQVMASETLLLSMAGVTGLAIAVNFIELLCTAGFPAIYTAVLTGQELAAPAYYGYLGLYIAGYLLDDSLMVAVAVVAMSNRKLTVNAGRWLKLLSGAVMLLLGLVLLLRPDWLL